MNETDKAYIAGLLDGEGSLSVYQNKSSKNGKLYWKLFVRITNTDLPVLEWVRSVVGFGYIYSNRRIISKVDGTPCKRCHEFIVARAQARLFLTTILPYMKIKKARAEEVLAFDEKHVHPKRA